MLQVLFDLCDLWALIEMTLNKSSLSQLGTAMPALEEAGWIAFTVVRLVKTKGYLIAELFLTELALDYLKLFALLKMHE